MSVTEEPPATSGLMAALLAVQAEAPKVVKDQTNPHFKSRFASLDAVMDAIGPILTRHGLVWATLPGRVDGEPALTYKLVHVATGETLEGSMPLMLKSADPQGQGSALTYARRYSIMAVLGLVPDEDDDGNRAQRASEREHAGPAYGKPAAPMQVESARRAIAFFLDCQPTDNPVGVVLNDVERRAGGYLPHLPLATVALVALAAKGRARNQAAEPGAGDPSGETAEEREERERAERIASETQELPDA